jgi:hypothetical protein
MNQENTKRLYDDASGGEQVMVRQGPGHATKSKPWPINRTLRWKIEPRRTARTPAPLVLYVLSKWVATLGTGKGISLHLQLAQPA